jgi:ABC-type dipeptide/oligopeptide/nickel transport system permease component
MAPTPGGALGPLHLEADPHRDPHLVLGHTLVFFAFRLIPGDAARILAGDEAPQERVEQIRRDLGLDKPAIVQYGTYLAGPRARRPRRVVLVAPAGRDRDRERFWNTFSLALAATALATVLGIAMGSSRRSSAAAGPTTWSRWWPSWASPSPCSGSACC